MFNIDDVINELERTNPNGFINETHFQIEFGYALKRVYPQYELTFEWKHHNHRIDLLAEDGNEKILFEFKYFTKAELRNLGVLKVQLKNQACKDLHRIGFWVDVAKVQSIPKINEAYCLFLTNDKKVFDKTNKGDREFDVSDGVRPQGLILRHYHPDGTIDNKHIVQLEKCGFNLKHQAYGNGLYLLALRVL